MSAGQIYLLYKYTIHCVYDYVIIRKIYYEIFFKSNTTTNKVNNITRRSGVHLLDVGMYDNRGEGD